jgi:ParB family transcriptional regulator, chromosome partitioning protein
LDNLQDERTDRGIAPLLDRSQQINNQATAVASPVKGRCWPRVVVASLLQPAPGHQLLPAVALLDRATSSAPSRPCPACEPAHRAFRAIHQQEQSTMNRPKSKTTKTPAASSKKKTKVAAKKPSSAKLLAKAPATRKPKTAAPAVQALPSVDIVKLPFENLMLSEFNVRRIGKDRSVDELVASIRASNVIQNLVVTPDTVNDKPTGKFGVVSGGRRYRALRQLLAEGFITQAYEVPCRIVPQADAKEISLAENVNREDMHPADQFIAFSELATTGHTLENIADRFGVSVEIVRRRLALANVAPKLFALFEADEISLEMMKALSISDDHAQQVAVWEACDKWDRDDPETIKRMLLAKGIEIDTDPRFKFVTVAAYTKAGGMIRKDLFAGDKHRGYALSPAILDQLVHNRLQAEAAKLQEAGCAFVDILPRADYNSTSGYVDLKHIERAPNTLEKAQLTQLDAAEFEINGKLDDCDETQEEALMAQLDELEKQREALHAQLKVLPADLSQAAGAYVGMEPHTGKLVVCKNLLPPGTKIVQAEDGSGVQAVRGAVKARAEYSEPVLIALAKARTQALQVALIGNASLALVVLAHAMAIRVFDLHRDQTALRLSPSVFHFSQQRTLASDVSANAVLLRAAWTHWGERLSAATDGSTLMERLAAFEQAELLAFLTFCSAICFDAGHAEGREDRGDEPAHLLRLNMATQWTPDAQFLSALASDKIRAIVSSAVSEEAAATLTGKKSEIVGKAEQLLQGLGWLPTPLRVAN